MPRLLPLSLALLLSLSLAGCGKRGRLEPPPGATPTATEKAEAKANAKASANTTAVDGTEGDAQQPGRTKLGGKKRVPITAPKRDLFIDAILD